MLTSRPQRFRCSPRRLRTARAVSRRPALHPDVRDDRVVIRCVSVSAKTSRLSLGTRARSSRDGHELSRAHAVRPGPARDLHSAIDRSEAGVIRVDRRARIVTRRLGTSALLGCPWLCPQCKPGDLELELAPVTRRELGGLGLKWLAGNRAHRASLLPAADRETGTLAYRAKQRCRIVAIGSSLNTLGMPVPPGVVPPDSDCLTTKQAGHHAGRQWRQDGEPSAEARTRGDLQSKQLTEGRTFLCALPPVGVRRPKRRGVSITQPRAHRP